VNRSRLLGLAALAALVAAGSGAAFQAPAESGAPVLGADVEQALLATAPGATLDVIVELREQADLDPVRHLPRSARLRAAVTALQATAERTQGRVRGLLRTRQAQGRVSDFESLWVFNALTATAQPGVVLELAELPEVAAVTLDSSFQAPAAPLSNASPEPNLSRVNAPAMWALGYRGGGIVVANMDTGVDVGHPDLASRWRGGTNSWYDPNGQHVLVPTDVNGHGTWTMGVMVAGDGGGTAVGMAPDARWIAVKIFKDNGTAQTSRVHQGFQWLLDPDGNPATPDAPHVVNNSWTLGAPGCSLEFEQDLANLSAAGILPVFAAGNYGPGTSTSASPANNPSALAVGETDLDDAIQAESSRGPSSCGEPSTVFPELVAPGTGIWTTDLFGLYTSQTGTSLSAPHVAGAVALLLDAFPDLSSDEQRSALLSGALDLGPAGPDSSYGYGRLDALAAYEWVASSPNFALAVAPESASTAPGVAASYTVSVTPSGGFSGDVALTLGGLSPSQAAWAFNPGTVAGGSGSSELTVTPSGSLPPGTYPLTITGTSGAITHSVPAVLVVTPPPDFALSVSPSSSTVKRGASTSYVVTVSVQGGFSGSVSLAVSGLPSGAAASFNPSSVAAPGSSTMTVTTSKTSPRGTFPLTVSGESGSLVRTATASLKLK
jgi:subtilisin family serine protease